MDRLKEFTKEYLRSFPEETQHFDHKSYWKKIKKGNLQAHNIQALSKKEKVAITLSEIFAQSQEVQRHFQKNKPSVLDQRVWQDLNLVCGNTTTPNSHVLGHINHTRTVAGESVLATSLVNPHTEAADIQKKKAVTKFLLKNKKIAHQIDNNIKGISKGESRRLSLFKAENPLTHVAYKEQLDNFYFNQQLLKRQNHSPWMLCFKKIWKDIWLHPVLPSVLFVSIAFAAKYGLVEFYTFFLVNHLKKTGGEYSWRFFYRNFDKYDVSLSLFQYIKQWFATSLLVPFLGFFSVPVFQNHNVTGSSKWDCMELIAAIGGPCCIPLGMNHSSKQFQVDTQYNILIKIYQQKNICFHFFSTLSLLLLPSIIGIYLGYSAYNKFIKNRSILNFLALHLLPFQDLLLHASKISQLVAKYPKLEALYGKNLTHTRKLLQKADQTSPISKMIHSLQIATLQNRWYFFSDASHMLVAYEQLKAHKNALADLQYEMGKVDAALSLQKLMKESQAYSRENHFIFGKTLPHENNLPVLNMEKMWNFGLDAQRVVSNDLAMDAATGSRLTTITGPNAGGKSTYILGIGSNAILYQAFGLVAATNHAQTIFSKIITYVNPTQNLAEGLSLAEAGMEVIKNHHHQLEKSQKPVLAIIDEILNGVDPAVAKKFSYKILKHRVQTYKNLLTLLTTHYMNLTTLAEESSHVSNKKVVVRMPGSNGRKFDYTYEIKEGIADQNIVEAMLEEKGILFAGESEPSLVLPE